MQRKQHLDKNRIIFYYSLEDEKTIIEVTTKIVSIGINCRQINNKVHPELDIREKILFELRQNLKSLIVFFISKKSIAIADHIKLTQTAIHEEFAVDIPIFVYKIDQKCHIEKKLYSGKILNDFEDLAKEIKKHHLTSLTLRRLWFHLALFIQKIWSFLAFPQWEGITTVANIIRFLFITILALIGLTITNILPSEYVNIESSFFHITQTSKHILTRIEVTEINVRNYPAIEDRYHISSLRKGDEIEITGYTEASGRGWYKVNVPHQQLSNVWIASQLQQLDGMIDTVQSNEMLPIEELYIPLEKIEQSLQ